MIRRYMMVALVIFGIGCIFAGGDGESIENVDYAVSISIPAWGNGGNGTSDDAGTVILYVANLMDYRGSSEQMLETLEYAYDIANIGELFELYREENVRQLSLSHIKKISAEGPSESDKWYGRILLELSDYVDISDEVELELGGEVVGYREFLRYSFSPMWED